MAGLHPQELIVIAMVLLLPVLNTGVIVVAAVNAKARASVAPLPPAGPMSMSVGPPRFCPQCGQPTMPAAQFCAHCGSALAAGQH